jgi:cobalt-zinc-cadmium efflux system protein
VGIAVGVSALELMGGYLSGSLALLSDAGHVGTDALAIGLTLWAMRISARPHTPRLSYGYHRLEILAAFLNSLALFGVAAYIVVEAYRRALDPPEVSGPVLLAVAVAGLGGNVTMILLLRPWARDSLNVQAAWLHVWSDTLGSVGVILGGAVIALTGTRIVDVVAALFVAALILYGALRLVRDSIHIFLEGSPRAFTSEDVAKAIREGSAVREVHDLHVWTVTSGLYMLSGHIVVDGSLTVDEASDLVRSIRDRLSRRFGIAHTTLQVDTGTETMIRPEDVRPAK